MRGDIEMCDNEDSQLLSKETINLRIRTKEGSELEIAVPYSGIVRDLKQEITDRLNLIDKHIRLIFSGKLLEPPDASLSLFKLKDGSFIHAVVTEKSQHTGINSPTLRSTSSSSNRIDMTNLRGLDALMLPGEHRSTLSLEEVASLRSYFQEDITEYAEDNIQRNQNESDTDFHYRCETEWMSVQGPSSEFRLNLYGRSLFTMNPALLSIERLGNEPTSGGAGARALQLSYDNDMNGNGSSSIEQGTWREFACGALMGFGCGYMMLFCMWDRNISQKQKLGIFVGMILSLLLSMTMQEQAGRGSNSNTSTTKSTYSSTSTNTGSSSSTTTSNNNNFSDFPVIDGLAALPSNANI